jgi:3-hydroxyacyl-[acyl-carrier-protein] dehydratase
MNRVAIDLVVPASHPSLPGHFPGKPIVPGVVLLALVHKHACQNLGFAAGASRWRRIKFLRPVQPDQHVILELDGQTEQFSFAIMTTSGEAVARGRCQHVELA